MFVVICIIFIMLIMFYLLMIKSIGVRIVQVVCKMYGRFYLTTSRIAVFIHSFIVLHCSLPVIIVNTTE